ncbi:MAG: hypothetical protein EB059_11200 [Alphaproteobacteria bacterium]|nr:hypothetical protein [Alphaproteobacteria bacterium]
MQCRKFFAELAQVVEQNSRLIVQARVEQVLFDFFDEGLDLFFFLCHAYTLPQRPEKARKIFAVVQSIYVDEKKLLDLARFLKVVLCKSFIFNDLRRAAGRAAVSR